MSDDQVTIETPEHIQVHYELAGVGSRALAGIFDFMLQAIITVLVVWGLIWLGVVLKLKDVLGAFPLPVEVIPMARSHVGRELARLGGKPALRQGFTTDNGNLILDVHGLSIVDPVSLEGAINQIVGVVTNGLFARRGADVLLLGTESGVRTMVR